MGHQRDNHGEVEPTQFNEPGDVYTLDDDLKPSWETPPASGGGSTADAHTFQKAICTFDETDGAGTYTATVPVIAGGRILEVVAFCLAGPWGSDTAVVNAGDTAQPAGYIDDAQVRSDLIGSLNTPYDPADVTPGGAAYKSWLDPAVASPQAVYFQAAALYAPALAGYVAGVPYPSGDDIVVTVVTTGALSAGGIGASTVADGGNLNAAGDTGIVQAGGTNATVTVDAVSGALPITGVNTGTQTFTVAGDQTTLFSNGDTIRVAGSTGNDGFYTVDTATFGAGATTVTTVEAVPDATANGDLFPNSGGVVTAYTLTAAGAGYSVASGVTVLSDQSVTFTIDIASIVAAGRLVVDVIGFGVTPETFAAVKS